MVARDHVNRCSSTAWTVACAPQHPAHTADHYTAEDHCETVHVHVRVLQGSFQNKSSWIKCEFPRDSTIFTLKEHISHTHHIPETAQSVVLDGHLLDEDQQLSKLKPKSRSAVVSSDVRCHCIHRYDSDICFSE